MLNAAALLPLAPQKGNDPHFHQLVNGQAKQVTDVE